MHIINYSIQEKLIFRFNSDLHHMQTYHKFPLMPCLLMKWCADNEKRASNVVVVDDIDSKRHKVVQCVLKDFHLKMIFIL